jgi:hypothetical protein
VPRLRGGGGPPACPHAPPLALSPQTHPSPVRILSCSPPLHPPILAQNRRFLAFRRRIEESRIENEEHNLRVELSNSHAELLSTHAELSNSRAELFSTRPELLNSHAGLSNSHAELPNSRAEPLSTRAGLPNWRAETFNWRAAAPQLACPVFALPPVGGRPGTREDARGGLSPAACSQSLAAPPATAVRTACEDGCCTGVVPSRSTGSAGWTGVRSGDRPVLSCLDVRSTKARLLVRGSGRADSPPKLVELVARDGCHATGPMTMIGNGTETSSTQSRRTLRPSPRSSAWVNLQL